MPFESFSDFIAMGDHGRYVWACYGVFFLLCGLLAWWSVFERRQVVRAQRFQQQMQSSGKGSDSSWSPAGEASFQRIQSSHSESASKP